MTVLKSKAFLRGTIRTPHSRQTRQGFEAMDRNERTADFPPDVMEQIRNLITPFLLRAYPEPEPFYEKLGRWLGFPREMLLLAPGADGVLRAIFETFVEPGEEVLHAVPSYAMVPVYCNLSGAVSRTLVFHEDLSLPLEQILEAINPRTKLVVLANPNQPIERLYTQAECRSLLARCREHQALLVLDEAYHPFCDETALPLVKEYENLIIVRSFSKAFGLAGLRLGYGVSTRENVLELNKVRPMYEANSCALAIAGYLLDNDHLMRSYVAQAGESRRFLREALENRGVPAQGRYGNSVLVTLPPDLSAPEVGKELRRKGFLVRAESTPPLSNHLRITVGPLEQAQRFLAAFENIVAAQNAQGIPR